MGNLDINAIVNSIMEQQEAEKEATEWDGFEDEEEWWFDE